MMSGRTRIHLPVPRSLGGREGRGEGGRKRE